MPKDDERKEMTQEEIDAREEKFRTFFTTSVAQVPEEMTRRDDENEEKPKSLLGRLLRREKGGQQESGTPEESRTGEIQLGGEEPRGTLRPGADPDAGRGSYRAEARAAEACRAGQRPPA